MLASEVSVKVLELFLKYISILRPAAAWATNEESGLTG